jgi:AcrR family transcriptional regulator
MPARENATIERGRRLRADVRRRLVVKVAFDFIAQHGLESFRTRDIASLAGINSATLHHHYPTKEDLIAAVADELADAFMSEKAALQKPLPRSATEELRGQFADACHYRDHRPELLAAYREFVTRAPRDPAIGSLVTRLASAWRGDIRRVIERGIKDGAFRSDIQIDAATDIVLNVIWGSVSSPTPGSASLEDLYASLIVMLERVAGPNG